MKCPRSASILISLASVALSLVGCGAQAEGETAEVSQLVKGEDNGNHYGNHGQFGMEAVINVVP